MKLQRYLVVDQDRKVRLTVGKPDITRHEIALRLDLSIPDSFFSRPIPVVSVDFPDMEAPTADAVVSVTAETVAEHLGLNVTDVQTALGDLLSKVPDADETE